MMEHKCMADSLTFDSLCFSSLDRKAGFSNTCLSFSNNIVIPYSVWFCEEITTFSR